MRDADREGGHIRGSVHAPSATLHAAIDSALMPRLAAMPAETVVIVHCMYARLGCDIAPTKIINRMKALANPRSESSGRPANDLAPRAASGDSGRFVSQIGKFVGRRWHWLKHETGGFYQFQEACKRLQLIDVLIEDYDQEAWDSGWMQ